MEKGRKILAKEQRWSLNRCRRVEKESHTNEGGDTRVGELMETEEQCINDNQSRKKS